jgi:hypothetical protein
MFEQDAREIIRQSSLLAAHKTSLYAHFIVNWKAVRYND